MDPPISTPLCDDPSPDVPTAHLPLAYLKAYPFAAFIVVHTPHGSDLRQSKLELIWTNGKIARSFIDRAVSKRDGYDLVAWLEESDAESTYTWSSNAGPLTLVKVPFPPHSETAVHRFHVITAITSSPGLRSSVRPPLNQQFSSFPSEDGDQWHVMDIAPPPGLAGPVIDCAMLLETTDWSKTALGPREKWSSALSTIVGMLMASPTPDALWVGTNFNMIYNQHYADTVDHPSMYGQSARVKEAWGPVWREIRDLVDACMLHGNPCSRENDLLLCRKSPSGHYLERYHTWSFVPIRDVHNQVIGMYNPTRDTTVAVVASRRQATLRDLAQELQLTDGVSGYFTGLGAILERNPTDIPFALVYSCLEGSQNGQVQLRLQTTVGIPNGHSSAPSIVTPRLDTKQSNTRASISRWQSSSPTPSILSTDPSISGSRFVRSDETTEWPLSQALLGRQGVLVKDCSSVVSGIPIRAWDHLPESAVIIPIGDGAFADTPRGLVVLGLNIRSVFDTEYEEWVLSLQSFLNASLNSICAREAEQELAIRNEKMEQAKTAWFQGAAHDLRSPLTLVAGPLDDVMRTSLSLSQRKLLNLANRNLARIQRLIDSLLDFSRLEAGQMVGHFVPVKLDEFVRELGEIFRPAVERRSIAYAIELESSDSAILIDPSLLEKAIMNLLSNALKYTNSGSIQLRLHYDTNVNIVVDDTGSGIAPDEVSRVTTRFHRAASATAQAIEGTGIGLALVKEISKLHEGELLISSRSGESSSTGSTFTISIPLEGRREAATHPNSIAIGVYGKQVLQEAMHWQNTSDSGDDPSDPARSVTDDSTKSEGLFIFDPFDTILLVDDNDEMREYVKRIFSPHCEVVEAANGQQALDIARARPPQLVLSDMMMPGMTGLELLTHLREDPITRLTPVVLLSAAVDSELRISALTMGAEDFMLKPFKPRELLARAHLQMHIGKKRAELESLYLQRAEEIALLSDQCPSGIMRADDAGRVVYANSAWRGYTGMPEEEDLNMWTSYVDSDSLLRLTSLWDLFLNGNERSTVISWRYLNGISVSGTFIRLNAVNANMTGILGCLQDTTFQEERLLDAERRKAEAEEARQQQELLVDITSHEIRTPVSAILQCSSVVMENLINLKRDLESAGPDGFCASSELLAELDADLKALESIHQCGLVQERIAADILSMTRLELDMLTINETEGNLMEEARKVVSLFASEAKMKGVVIDLDFGDLASNCQISTDHVRLGQVVTNLLANAIKFTSHSSTRNIMVRYELAFEPPADWPESPARHAVSPDVNRPGPVWLQVAVRDTGPGLKHSEQAIVFERFVQGNKMVNSKYGGTGLGLFICRKRLDGKITVKSQLGAGSEFLFYIRTRMCPDSDQHLSSLSDQLHDTRLSNDSLDVSGPLARRTLLIVEDNLINSTVLQRQMTKAGWDCEVANNGQEALSRLEARRYDVVLMDLEMPVMDGMTAITHIRKIETGGPRQLVIALTGNARQGQVDQALEAGMDDVILKPYKLDYLVQRLNIALQRRGSGGEVT